jgi:hypothetical protein
MRVIPGLSLSSPSKSSGLANPRLDAHKARSGFRPDAELRHAVKSHFDRWPRRCCIGDAPAVQAIEDQSIIGEQRIRQGEFPVVDGRRDRSHSKQAAGKAADRLIFKFLKRNGVSLLWHAWNQRPPEPGMKAQRRRHHVLAMVRHLGPHVQLKANDFVVKVERKLEGIVRSGLLAGAKLKTAPCSFASCDVEGRSAGKAMPSDGIPLAVHRQSIATHLADNRKKDRGMARPTGRVAGPQIVKTIGIPQADQFGLEARDCRPQFGAFNRDALRAPITHVPGPSSAQGWLLKTLPPFITKAMWRRAVASAR